MWVSHTTLSVESRLAERPRLPMGPPSGEATRQLHGSINGAFLSSPELLAILATHDVEPGSEALIPRSGLPELRLEVAAPSPEQGELAATEAASFFARDLGWVELPSTDPDASPLQARLRPTGVAVSDGRRGNPPIAYAAAGGMAAAILLVAWGTLRARPKRQIPHVVFVHPSDELYGADRVLLEVIEACRAEASVEVWLPTDITYPERRLSRELTQRGIPVRMIDLAVMRRDYLTVRSAPSLAVRMMRSAWLLRQSRPDVLYLNTSATALLTPWGRLFAGRTVVHLHEFLDGAARRVAVPLLRQAHAVIAVSNAIVIPLPRGVQRRTVVVHNGFQLDDAGPVRESDQLRVVLASRWNSWKGHAQFLEAWGNLERGDLRLRILGGPPLSGSSVDVPSLVAALSNADTVEIVGESMQMPAELAEAVAVVVPSTRPDPLPTIAIEALGAGRMVLASRTGGLPEIVTPGTGLLIDPDDTQGWTAALESLDAAMLRSAGRQARQRYEDEFTRERFDATIATIVDDQLTRSGHPPRTDRPD